MLRSFLITSSVIAMATAATAQDSDLLVFDYSGFEFPQFHPAYIEKHGASPEFAFFADEEEAFRKLASGFRADVAHICADSVTKWVQSGLIEPWDTSKITAFDDLNKDLVGTDIAGNGDVYFIPTDYGSTAIAYNPELVPAEDVASLDVFRNPAYAGKITLPNNASDAYALAYLATGVTDWSTVTEEQFEAASNWLREVHPNLRTYWTDPAELSQLLSSGEVTISWAWNETYPTMVEEERPIAFQRETTEGSSVWLCGNVKLKDGKGVDAKAYDYVNAVLDPSATQALMDDGYGQANAKAMQTITQEDLVAAGLEAIDVPVLAQLPLDQEMVEKQTAAFEMIKAGF